MSAFPASIVVTVLIIIVINGREKHLVLSNAFYNV